MPSAEGSRPISEYDVITVGGGLGGSALAKTMAESGARVLVLEREQRFRDRVRGESLLPWGIPDARALGLEAPLVAQGACAVPGWTVYRGPEPQRRDLPTTTPSHSGLLNCSHPTMQEVLIALAAEAGAEVRRGVSVIDVTAGQPAQVSTEQNGARFQHTARLVVGADGRNSSVRRWAGFEARRDPPGLTVSGLLFNGMAAPPDSAHLFGPPSFGKTAFYFPQSDDRVRAYFSTARRGEYGPLSGANHIDDFIRACCECGTPKDWFAGATACGPLATFDGSANWVEHPFREGIVLIGDAAATSDPTFGAGQSLTLRDVRVLAELLRANEDWDSAAHQYAVEHNRYFSALHTVEAWMTRILFTAGTEGDQIRARAMPALQRGLGPDPVGLGPDSPVDETARQHLFGPWQGHAP